MIKVFTRQCAWVKPCGEVLTRDGVYNHHDMISDVGDAGYHDGAFKIGYARVCMDVEGILSIQWEAKLTSAQRGVFEDVMQTATSLIVSSVQDGYDPEEWAGKASSCPNVDRRKIPASFVRLVRAALRTDMGSFAKPTGAQVGPEGDEHEQV